MQKNHNHNPIYGYFGKLPVFNDFVKYNAGNNEVLVLDKWLQEGIILARQKLKGDWKSVYKSSMPLKFFYPFTGSDKLISGVIFPGSDKSGRDFPFLMFCIFNNNIIDSVPFYLMPLQFINEFNSFESIFDEINANTTLDNLNEQINEVASYLFDKAITEQYQTFINNTLQKDFWNRIFVNFIEEKKYRLVNNIFNPEINNNKLPLRINLISELENSILNICFLLNILAISKDNFFLPALFWNKDINNNISLNIFPSHPASINYVDMIYSNDNDDRIFNLEEKAGFAQAPSLNKDILDKEINLKELLQILGSL